MKRQTELTNRVVVKGIQNNGRVKQAMPEELRGKPRIRVWTIYNDKEYIFPADPVHNKGVFLEDCVHDYQWFPETCEILFYTRAIKVGASVPLLVEY